MSEAPPDRSRLLELAKLFLMLGTVSFGGPAAHIALMEEHVVRRRAWLSRDDFLDLLGATNLIPGPNSTEMAIHLGYLRAGLRGLLVAGVCFILPAALIVAAIASLYVRFGRLPVSVAILDGVKPVVIAIVANALWRLGRTAIKTRWLAAIGVASTVAVALGVSELVVLFAAALLAVGVRRAPNAIASFALPLAATTVPVPVGLAPLFLVFAKIGSILFGSGYVLVAFLRTDLVERLGWLTEPQLLDAIAVGQVTPGPVFTTATFVGYVLAGPGGALVATLGIFAPAFLFVALSAPLIPRLRNSPTTAGVLDGLNVASLALMAVATAQLAGSALRDPLSVIVSIACLALLLTTRVNPTWLVLAGAILGVARDLSR